MMRFQLFVLLLMVSCSISFAQEKDCNIELNYAIVPADGFGGKDNVVDFGFKYRFLKKEIINLGVSSNFGIFNNSLTLPNQTEDLKNFIFQPRVFTEIKLPFSKKIKPIAGIGYSYIFTNDVSIESFWGFNVNAGLSYDILKDWLVQLHYDYVSLSAADGFEGFNNIRLGIGYRF